MKILIIYGTSEGQTRKIARFMEEVLQEEQHKVVIADASDEPPAPTNFDMVLIGSSVHMHKYHSAVKNYILEHVEALNQKNSAFFSVSLSMAAELEEEHQEVHAITKKCLESTLWNPTETIHIAGALRYSKYDFFKRLIMRMIAKQQGAGTDTSQDQEYTDWDAVKSFALNFVQGK
jgi:menaquinone-dependent protoporphyrinogen oxidase